jgi:hypothetical protein
LFASEGRQSGRQSGRQKGRKAGKNAGRQTDRQLYRKAKNIPIYIKKDREKDRPADWLPSDRYIGSDF